MTDYIKYEVRVYADGRKCWFLNGKRHREDGPAVEASTGYKAWYLNDECLTEEEHRVRMSTVVEMTMAEICKALGKTVKVIR
jgi:hypothetical protein